MARTFSSAATEAMASQNTGEGEVVLLTIEPDSNADYQFTPVRLANNTIAITSNGNTFQAFAFEATLPEESDRARTAKLVVDNADRLLVDELRKIKYPALATLQVVLFSSPDTIEMEVGPLRIEEASIGLTQIEISLGGEPFTYQPIPPGRFTPQAFPGLF